MGDVTTKATIHDVAKLANVSITTVSLVLNNKTKSIGEETIKRVKQAVKDCNYTPNLIAASMITKKTKTIGYIIPDIQNMFFSEIAKNVEMEIVNKGYNLILSNSDDKYERDYKAIISLVKRNIDLLIFSPSVESLKLDNIDQIYKLISSLDIPCIIVDRDLGNKDYNMIVNDNEFGGYIATKHLIENGHKNIAFISGPLEVSSARLRYNGYYKALSEASIMINPAYLLEGDYYFESGYKLAKRIIKDKSITAVFVSNDLMAYGVYQACREEGIKIPDDLSIVGFDDLYFSNIIDVPLTSVKQDISLMSQKICSFIFSSLKKGTESKATTQKVIITPTLTIRNSVRKIR